MSASLNLPVAAVSGRAAPLLLALLALALTPNALSAQGQVNGDFDNDGFDDVAIGVPKENKSSVGNCGAVHILYGATPNLTAAGTNMLYQSNIGLTDEKGDQFGHSLAVGDFNGDGFDDLAIGIPYEDVGAANQGGVAVVYGSSSGLTPSGMQFLTRSGAIANEYFGYALTAANFTASAGFDELAVGVPGLDIGSAVDAGGVVEFLGGSSGLSSPETWSQNTAGIVGGSESSDRFAFSLTSGNFNSDGANDLAVGVYLEDLAVTNDGFVNVIYGIAGTGLDATGNHGLSDLGTASGGGESSDQFGWSLAAGDFGGDGDDDLAIGVPLENIGSSLDAGEVQVYYGAAGGIIIPSSSQQWNQDTASVPGGVEVGDKFGYALTSADFDGDGIGDLAVGCPTENFSVTDDGFVIGLYGASGSLTGTGSVGLSDTMCEGGEEVGDQFGNSLSAADVNASGAFELIVGIPFEDIIAGAILNAGGVNLRYALVGTNQCWTQDTAGVLETGEADDNFGAGLGR